MKNKTSLKKLSRRNFIKASAMFGGVMILPSCAAKRVRGANDRFNVALIGVGGIGIQAINKLKDSDEADIVAGCDVDEARSANSYAALAETKKYPHLRRFKDFRIMLDETDSDIDGVIISTPDHMHYPISSWTMSRGKHTFCQKPLARTVWECAEMKRLAKKYGVFTQMGNQGHTNPGWRIIREWYEYGLLGKVEDIYMWTDRAEAYWKQGIDVAKPAGEPVPSTLDYKLWLGVAPYQPYNHEFVPHDWRACQNYGTGAIGDMACHFFDVPYSAFNLGLPTKILANPDPFNDYSWPKSSSIYYEFANERGRDGKIRLHWFDGYRKPKNIRGVEQSFIDDPKNKNCTIIVCEKETIITNEYGWFVKVHPRERMIELKKAGAFPKETLARSVTPNNPHLEFVKYCIKGENPPANFDYASAFTQTGLLGLAATLQKNTELAYDPESMSFKNRPEADKFLRSRYEYNSDFIA